MCKYYKLFCANTNQDRPKPFSFQNHLYLQGKDTADYGQKIFAN